MSELNIPRSAWMAFKEAERIIASFGCPEVGRIQRDRWTFESGTGVDGVVKTGQMKVWCFNPDSGRRHKFFFEIKMWQRGGEWIIVQTLYVAYAQIVNRELLPAICAEAYRRGGDGGEYPTEIELTALAGENGRLEFLAGECRYHNGRRKSFIIKATDL